MARSQQLFEESESLGVKLIGTRAQLLHHLADPVIKLITRRCCSSIPNHGSHKSGSYNDWHQERVVVASGEDLERAGVNFSFEN